MISTKDTTGLPGREKLQATCKAMAVLDAILSQDWEYRYYSYNSAWSETEAFFEMRDGQGDQMLILFREEGCVINGFSAAAEKHSKEELTNGMPEVFNEFIFGEPVNSIGTTCCLWTTGVTWETGILPDRDDLSRELLGPLDGKPETYIKWASAYFEGTYSTGGIPLETVTRIYNQEPLSKEMVLSITAGLEDWEQLEADLIEISYPYHKFQ
jgi:hypothetical protein